MRLILSATTAFKTVMGKAVFAEDPTARNSNLFPVKAKGDVLFLSVLSLVRSGITNRPRSYKSLAEVLL